jgi:nicotinate phosphoribosyltransferase
MNDKFLAGLLDQDLYKFTMGCAVAKLYPRLIVKYRFFNRGNTSFPPGFADNLQALVNDMPEMLLTQDEYMYLSTKCGTFLDPVYLDFLKGYRFDPSEVSIRQIDDELLIDIEGPWYRTIYWEVPLMALISELYFTDPKIQKKHYIANATSTATTVAATIKAGNLLEAGCVFADFGTRRRFSRDTHQRTVEGLIIGAGNVIIRGKKFFVGTSNVHMAKKYGIKCIGTHAHEWFSAHAAMFGYRIANKISLDKWVEVYKGALGIALTDTFTTKNFWKNFDPFHAKLFDGVRHDSGDPFKFGEDTIAHYESLGIDPMSKNIIFSDGLNVDKAIEIQERFHGRIKLSFGIGTHFTNDVGPKSLNMVIKLTGVKVDDRWVPAIKLSDDEGKNTGDKKEIELAKGLLA